MNAPIGARREQPRLGGVEHHAQRPQRLNDRVCPEHLHRHDQGVAHEVGIHRRVEHVHGAVVGRARHQGIPRMEADGTQRALVVLEGLVRGARQVEVEPNEAPVERPHDDVISGPVHVQRRDVSAAGREPLHHDLLHEVVHAHVCPRRHEEERLVGVEARELRLPPLRLTERLLRRRLRQLVDEHGRGAGRG